MSDNRQLSGGTTYPRPATFDAELRARAVFDTVVDGILTIDQHGIVASMNPAAERIFGHSADDVVGRNISMLMPEPYRSEHDGYLQNYISTGEARIIGIGRTVAGRRKDGSVFPLELAVGATRIGDEFLFTGIVRDITERVLAEQVLREAQARASAVFDTVVDGIITIDASGLIESFNPAAQRIFGYAASEVVGRNVAVLMPEPYRAEHDGYLHNYLTTGIARIIGIGRTVAGRRKDGTIFPLDLAVGETRIGDRPSFTGIVRDVTDRVTAEQSLRDAEARTRAIVATVPDAILVVDTHGIVETVNPAAGRIFGCADSELVGRGLDSLVDPASRESIASALRQALADGPSRGATPGREVTALRADGTPFPLEVAFGGLSHSGDRVQITAVARDITERKRADAVLREAQKMESLGVLAGGIAHDFNNLLVGILGNAGLAIDELNPESSARPLLRDIETAGKRAADLAHQMLAYSGKGRFSIEAIDMNQLVEEMTHLLRVSINKGAILRYNLSPGLPAIEADPTQVRQVIMNLVINASDAIGERSGTITISTGVMHADRSYLSEPYHADVQEGDFVFLEVSDTGSGMPTEVRLRIFDPFFTTKFTGRGLGLAVVLGVVRGHKGAVKVYSEERHGTTFKVLLPAPRVDSPRAPAGRPDVWQSKGLVLVIDDDETVRTVTTRVLQRSGLTVLTADDGAQGIEVYRQHQAEVDVILLDLSMPHVDGEAAFRELRRIHGSVRIILMSGYNELDVTERFSGKGVTAFIQKPYQAEELRQLVRRILEQPV